LEAKLPKKQDPVWRSRIWIRNPVNGSQDPNRTRTISLLKKMKKVNVLHEKIPAFFEQMKKKLILQNLGIELPIKLSETSCTYGTVQNSMLI
jgi:hypothetical protein